MLVKLLQGLGRVWKTLALSIAPTLRTTKDIIINIGIVGMAIGLLVFIVKIITDDAVIINPLAVSPRLQEDGYTSEVITSQLASQLLHILAAGTIDSSSNQMRIAGVPLSSYTWAPGSGRQPVRRETQIFDVEVPGLGSSSAITAFARQLFGTSIVLEGEIISQADNHRMIVRLPEHRPIQRDGKAVEELIISVAEQIVVLIDPCGLALYHYSERDHPEAADAATQCLSRPPRDDDALGYYLRGAIGLERYETMTVAAPSFRQSIKLDKHFVPARIGLSQALYTTGRFTEARDELEATLRIQPSSARAKAFLGLVHAEIGDEGQAERHLAAATKTARHQTPEVLSIWAFVLQELGKHEAALAKLEEAIAFDSYYIPAQFLRAYVYFNLGNLYEAEEALKKALEVADNDGEIYAAWAGVHVKREVYTVADMFYIAAEASGYGDSNMYNTALPMK